MWLKNYIESRRFKNNNITYQLKEYCFYFQPRWLAHLFKTDIVKALHRYPTEIQKEIIRRTNYYNKLEETVALHDTASITIHQLKDNKLGANLNGYRKSGSMYVFDSNEYLRFYSPRLKAGFLYGDITKVPDTPCFVKSRPIHGDNRNSVLLMLNKKRHFMFVKDKKRFRDKKDMLIGRAYVDQPQRFRFWEMYYGHPLCDLGNINNNVKEHPEWLRKSTSILRHLDYKFILCIEGNDVATNLKWVMSSNSLAVMPPPTYETWFMEGELIADYHYVAIKPDYSDLEEKLRYYMAHPEKAEEIIQHAHDYIKPFRKRRVNKLISLMVLDKYFIKTGQMIGKYKTGKEGK